MRRYAVQRGVDPHAGEAPALQAHPTSPAVRDTVIFGGDTFLRVSLDVVTNRAASSSYVIRAVPTASAGSACQTSPSSHVASYPPGIRTSELGWTEEQATAIRRGFSSWTEDWDDPALDAYNVYLQG